MELFQLFIDIRGEGGIAHIRVDLDGRHGPDPHWIERISEVMDIGGNDEAAARDFRADDLWLEPFTLGHATHSVGDDAAPGLGELRRRLRDLAGCRHL